MWRLFITLYLLIAAFGLSIDSFVTYYVDTFHKEVLAEDDSKVSKTWLLALEHFSQDAEFDELKNVFSRGNQGSNLPVNVLSMEEFENQYPQAVSGFNEYSQFHLDFDKFEFLYKMTNRPAVLKIGPIDTSPELSDLWTFTDYLTYFLLAVLILLWQLNLWRKLVGLEKQVVEFGEGNLTARASENPGARIGKLNNTFNSMADKTSQLLLQNKQLIRAVSHELRAPISRLRCQVDLLDTDSNRSQYAPYVDDMSGDITALENLVGEILDFSRLEVSNSASINVSEQNLKPLLSEILAITNREYSRDFSLHCAPDVCARIDDILIRRAIGNLVQNAARYCAYQVEVRVELDEKSALVVVHVDDDGPGIPENERDRIFEPFARLDQSRTRNSGGYGLGLAIVKQIAALHEGDVLITKSPLNGARFSLRLPACSAQQDVV